MKKLYLLIIIALYIAISFSANATNISVGGNISSNTTWNTDTIKIISDITIDDGVTLTITNGTYVQAQGHYAINVQGVIIANGTSNSRITFTSISQGIGWKGLRFNNTPLTNDSSRFNYCTFTYGKSNIGSTNDKIGGVLFANAYPKIIINNSIFANNYAQYGGAIGVRSGSHIKIFNTLIVNNSASSLGGGMFIFGTNNVEMTNLTIAKNTANKAGGIYGTGTGPISNCIIYANTASTYPQVYGSSTNVSYCNIEGGYSSGFRILDTDPGFVSATTNAGSTYDGLTADYSLTSNSNMIDMGNYHNISSMGMFDVIGNFRYDNNKSDIGAYERINSTEVCGTITTNTTWTGNVLINCDVVVNDGVTLTIMPGANIITTGHYKLDIKGTLLAQGNSNNYITIKSWDKTEGWQGLIFDQISTSNDSSKVEYCKISNKVYATSGDNHGAIYVNYTDKLLIRNNIISNNRSKYGGGLSLYYSSAVIVGNLIGHNEASNYGAGIRLSNNSSKITNNTIVSNKNISNQDGAGVYSSGSNSSIFKNNIIYYNANSNNTYSISENISSGLSISYSCLQGAYAGTGNITSSPNFKNRSSVIGVSKAISGYNYALSETSLCIDAGNTSTSNLNLPTEDLVGKVRKYSAAIDIGAYEDKSILAVCGTINSDEIWDANTININCDVTIPSGVTVTIAPGTKVLFKGHYNILVEGAINARGTQTDSIFFTSENTVVGWDGIFIHRPWLGNDSCIFSYCSFTHGERTTSAGWDHSATLSVDYCQKLDINNCLFSNNNTTLSKNIAALTVFNTYLNNPITVSKNTFKNNTGRNTVRLYDGVLNFNENVFIHNTSSDGSVLEVKMIDGTVNGNIVANNESLWGAVSLASDNGTLNFTNNIVVNNTGTYLGGIKINDVKARLYNNTIANNKSLNTYYTGGIYLTGNADAIFKNNIIYGNELSTGAAQQINISAVESAPKFYNNDIEGDFAAIIGAGSGLSFTGIYTDNIDTDPDFVAASAGAGKTFDGINADWSLNLGSILINNGLESSASLDMSDKDFDKNSRIYNGRIDMGAIENQEAIQAPCTINSDIVWEADTVKITCDITVESTKTLTIMPGTNVLFMGHHKIDVKGCIIAEGTDDNRISFSINDTTGFADSTLTNGGWNGINFASVIRQLNDTSRFSYCDFSYAKTGLIDKKGAIMNIYNTSKIIISNSVFANSMANDEGGAIYIESSNIKFINNLVSNNTAGNSGGGMYIDDCNIDFFNNTIVNNKAKVVAGVQFVSSESIIKNSIFWGNRVWNSFYLTSQVTSQLDFNQSDGCIMKNSNSQYGKFKIHGSLVITYEDNYDIDPEFINPSQGVGSDYNAFNADWRIGTSSPMLNKGKTVNVTSSNDLNGRPRIVNDTIDIGAYEVQISSKFIDLQPTAKSICEGSILNFATHAAFSAQYQWQKNGNNIAGADAPIYLNSSVSLADSGLYNCIISNEYGSISSDTVELSVLYSPSITASPIAVDACLGSSVSFSADADGSAPVTYKWYNTNGLVQTNSGNSNSQAIEIGDDTLKNLPSGYPSPFANYYFGSKNQYLILASELTAMGISAGDMSSLAFDVNAINACPSLSNFEIKIGTTTNTALTSTWLSGLTSVYSVNSYQPTAGWNTFGFTNAFTWDGSSNIVIEICSNNSSWISNGNASVKYTVTSFNSVAYYKNDNATVCSYTGTSNISTKRPNIKLTAQAVVQVTENTYSINSITSNDASNYYMIASNTCGSDQSSGAILGINYKPTITSIPATENICEDASVSYVATSQGTNPITYQWYKDGSMISGEHNLTYNITSADTSNSGIYYCKASNLCGYDSTNQSVLTVDEKPRISSQSSSITVCENQSTSIYVTTTGTGPITYQWYKAASIITGATNNSYTISSISLSDDATYYCYVSNGCTSTPVVSTGIDITVNESPSISTQTINNEVCEGSATSFSITATGTATLNYQWYNNSGLIASATNNIYNIGSVSSADAGNYYCTVSNSCGTANSNSIPLTVNTIAVINNQPSALTKCESQSALFDVQATATTTVSYQWYKAGSQINGATASSYLISPVSLSDDDNYYCKITNVCGDISSANVDLTVNSNVSISSQSTSATICEGVSPTLSVTTSGTLPITYQWFVDNDSIIGATNNTYAITSIDTANSGNYYCLATNVCSSLNSSNITLDVELAPSISNQPISNSVCENLSTVFNVSVSGTVPMTYQWYDGSGSITGATNASYIIPQASVIDAGSYYVKATNSCGSIISNTAALTVNEDVSISSQSSSTTICEGIAANFSITATGTEPITYQWFADNDSIVGASNNIYLIASVDTSNIGDYYVSASNMCNTINSSIKALDVKQSPNINTQPMDATICSGSSVQMSINASGSSPLTYQWYKATASINGENNSSYLINQATISDEAAYYVQVNNTCGSTVSNTANVTVNSGVSISAQSASISVCEGSSANFNITASGTMPIMYQWFVDNDTIITANNNIYSIAATDTSNIGDYYVIASNVCNSVNSSTKVLNVKQAPSIITQPTDDTICSGSSILMTVNASGSSPLSYQWYKTGSIIPNGVSSNYLISQANNSDATTYNVEVSNSCGSISSNDNTITINELVSINIQSGDSSKCEGESMSFNITADGSGPISYQWYYGTNPIANEISDQYDIPNVVIADAGYYHIEASNMCNTISSTYKSLTVNANPVITLGNDTSFCDGGSVTYSAGFGMQSIWSNGSYNNQINVTSTGSFFVNVVDQNSCSATSDTVNVNVLYPYASQELCVVGVDTATNKNILVWDKATNGAIESFNIYKESAVSNVWNLIGNQDYDSLSRFIDLASSPDIKADKYAISVVDSCGNESAKSPVHRTMHLTVNAGQSASTWNLIWNAYQGFTAATYRIYRADTSLNFIKIDSLAGSSAYTYTWTDNTAPTYSDVYYMIEIVHPNGGCSPSKVNTNYNSSRSNRVNSTSANPNVTLNPDFIADVTTGAAPINISFYDLTTNGTVSTWFWNFGDGETSTVKNPVHQYTTEGVYHVSLTVTNENGSQSIVKDNYIDVLPNGIEDIHNDFDVAVFPNPYKGSTNIAYNLQKEEKVIIQIYSSLGELVDVIANEVQYPGSYKYKFNATEKGYSTGVYFLRMTIGNKLITKRMVQLK